MKNYINVIFGDVRTVIGSTQVAYGFFRTKEDADEQVAVWQTIFTPTDDFTFTQKGLYFLANKHNIVTVLNGVIDVNSAQFVEISPQNRKEGKRWNTNNQTFVKEPNLEGVEPQGPKPQPLAPASGPQQPNIDLPLATYLQTVYQILYVAGHYTQANYVLPVLAKVLKRTVTQADIDGLFAKLKGFI